MVERSGVRFGGRVSVGIDDSVLLFFCTGVEADECIAEETTLEAGLGIDDDVTTTEPPAAFFALDDDPIVDGEAEVLIKVVDSGVRITSTLLDTEAVDEFDGKTEDGMDVFKKVVPVWDMVLLCSGMVVESVDSMGRRQHSQIMVFHVRRGL